jgi:hypothetical protein
MSADVVRLFSKINMPWNRKLARTAWSWQHSNTECPSEPCDTLYGQALNGFPRGRRQRQGTRSVVFAWLSTVGLLPIRRHEKTAEGLLLRQYRWSYHGSSWHSGCFRATDGNQGFWRMGDGPSIILCHRRRVRWMIHPIFMLSRR